MRFSPFFLETLNSKLEKGILKKRKKKKESFFLKGEYCKKKKEQDKV